MIDDERIHQALAQTAPSRQRLAEILAKAESLAGLDLAETAALTAATDDDSVAAICASARKVKEKIYGRRLVFFAPLYVSNLCANECAYCAFRVRNQHLKRRALRQDEIAEEVRILVEQGHKRILLVAGEAYPAEGLRYIIDAIATIYRTHSGRGEIRRVNVNIAPLSEEEFRLLKQVGIGTYQLFQETYHRPTYERVHLAGPKRDYNWRLTAMDRALSAGLDDVGIGILFGLYDWRYEILALLSHAHHLDKRFGVGPHTISVPRLEPAHGSEIASHPPAAVDDRTFCRIVAILRLAVPYTGIIMSTRETPRLRRETFAFGVSQISAGSRTNPGGYTEGKNVADLSQFSLGDHRSLDEVVRDVAEMGYIPSFCTACYRSGRTGQDFMDLAKPGEIKNHCHPNALATFLEYLEDYASPQTKQIGAICIQQSLAEMDERTRRRAERMLERIKAGERDVYC